MFKISILIISLFVTGCSNSRIGGTPLNDARNSDALVIASTVGGDRHLDDKKSEIDTINALDEITAGNYVANIALGAAFDTMFSAGLFTLLFDANDIDGWGGNNVIVFLDADMLGDKSNEEIFKVAYDKIKDPVTDSVISVVAKDAIFKNITSTSKQDVEYTSDEFYESNFFYGASVDYHEGDKNEDYVLGRFDKNKDTFVGASFFLKNVSKSFHRNELPPKLQQDITYQNIVAVRILYVPSVTPYYLLTDGNLSIPKNVYLYKPSLMNTDMKIDMIPTVISQHDVAFFIKPQNGKQFTVPLNEFKTSLVEQLGEQKTNFWKSYKN